MLSKIGMEALTEWMVFEELEPQAVDRADYLHASTLHFFDQRLEMLAEIMVQLKTGKQPPRNRPKRALTEFLVRFGDDVPAPTRKQTWQEQWAILKQYALAHSTPKKKARPKRATRQAPVQAKKIQRGRR